MIGRKPATLFASVVFLLGSLACGLSKTYPQVSRTQLHLIQSQLLIASSLQLIAARTFAGIGGGGVYFQELNCADRRTY